jgi:hypothetical protein
MATKNYTVWVGGGEVNDCYLNKKDAYALAKEWRDKGYDDVLVERNWYYRVFDTQTWRYFSTGYNATSKRELLESFQSYIRGADDIALMSINSWKRIEEYLQGLILEKSHIKFEEEE